ncbi:DUF5753 domain-containing protein [Streptomyces sp. NRRL F-2580]|uniref:DUF5753 domain-containing protein n=1 Tax=Streptomyces sp. NRRL F-2580 TaxID=1463841 RepID=UPI002D21959A|nr:DUF5753 domain-containing protein [Streptomyces sp. NRRL F-2580]
MVPGLLQTPAYAAAVIAETIPLATAEQAAARLEVRLRRQNRVHHPARSFRLRAVLDESALRRAVGSPAIMREQLEHLNHLGAQPHVTVQVLPHKVGAHAGVSGQFSVLRFADASGGGTVCLERSTSGLYLEKRSDVQHYGVMYEHLQARALNRTTAAGSSPTPPRSTPRCADCPPCSSSSPTCSTSRATPRGAHPPPGPLKRPAPVGPAAAWAGAAVRVAAVAYGVVPRCRWRRSGQGWRSHCP